MTSSSRRLENYVTVITSLKVVNRLKNNFRLPVTVVSGNLKLIFSLLTD